MKFKEGDKVRVIAYRSGEEPHCFIEYDKCPDYVRKAIDNKTVFEIVYGEDIDRMFPYRLKSENGEWGNELIGDDELELAQIMNWKEVIKNETNNH